MTSVRLRRICNDVVSMDVACTVDVNNTGGLPISTRKSLHVVDELEVEERVKRPLNAFMVWSQIERRKLSVVDPTLHNSEISRVLGQRWRELSDADRQPFIREALHLRAKHGREHPNYKFRPQRKTKRQAGTRRPFSVCQSTTGASSGAVSNRLHHEATERSADNRKMVKCFRATFGANRSFAVDKFAFLESVPATTKRHLPVKLTIDKSFRENLKSSKNANFSAVSFPPRPSTPTQDYQKFADELQRYCMSTPGHKFDDSGWASNSNSVNSFCTDSTLSLHGDDDDDCLLDVETTSQASPSFDGVTLTEPLFPLSTSIPSNESLVALSEPDAIVSFDANDSADSLQEWSIGDLPSSWQAVADNLDLDNRFLPLAFDHFDDFSAADINDIVNNGSQEVNGGLDYFPEVNELLAYVGE